MTKSQHGGRSQKYRGAMQIFPVIIDGHRINMTREQIGAMGRRLDAAEKALSSGAALDEVTALLDECYDDYYRFSTMYTLAEIRYLRDLTDEYYGAE